MTTSPWELFRNRLKKDKAEIMCRALINASCFPDFSIHQNKGLFRVARAEKKFCCPSYKKSQKKCRRRKFSVKLLTLFVAP